jgi:hypothetical protein
MSLHAPAAERAFGLPPPYRLLTLRESGDAFAHACRIAAREGAGTLVWVRRFDLAEFAVVLEPEEPLAEARRAFYAGMNALADALTPFTPPTMALSFDWPDGLRVDGVLVGGGRLGWPEADEDRAPDWLVFSATVRTAVIRASDPGMRPLLGGLDELGFEAVDSGEILQSFARHLMAGLHDWAEDGFGVVEARYAARLARPSCPEGRGGRPDDLERLREALRTPSWLNPQTGAPWL